MQYKRSSDFKAKINCEEQVTLNKLSKNSNISFQMVSLIEKKT